MDDHFLEESESLTPAEKKHRQEIGQRIKQERERKDWRQPDLAVRVGLSGRAATVTDWESGKKMPDAVILGRLADALGVSSDWLLGRPQEGRYRLSDADQEEIAKLHARIGKVLVRDPALREIAASLDRDAEPD